MARYAEGENYLLKYITEIPNDYKCAVGLILGQISSQKYHVIHFAKTPQFQDDENKKSGKPLETMKSISEVNDSWVADHARQTTRMLPGGLHVLGLFLVTDEDVLNPFHSKLRSLLTAINKILGQQNYLFGNNTNEKLILHYSGKNKRYQAKTYDVASLSVQPVDFKFIQKGSKWMTFECEYEIDHIYYLNKNDSEGPLKKHIKVILDSINSKLNRGLILFDNDFKDVEDKIDNLYKKKKTARGSSNKTVDHVENKPILVTILEETALHELPDTIELINIGGQIRIVGQVVSKTWFNSKTSIGEVIQAVKEDIMRSLATRVDMHWDSLTEEELGEEINSVHEPPRRVLITLPECNVTISDYLFPGEGPEDVKASLEELLDIVSHGDLEVSDLEGQTDISQYYQDSTGEVESEDILPQIATDPNKFKFFLGLGTALLILFISIIFHLVGN
ncbi:protein odr-4 homolog [Rhynchophorus ferrugineus]|uniref:Protein odr-4 homolog n=1 Tax=Rhynchophorus ferrugineus TaxID=354439 RepID=A0A834IDW3_RHYFE|nr:hypothetical protein GWI33_007217 [Rhynchophorus ferrugineus]